MVEDREATSHLVGKSVPGWNYFSHPKPATAQGSDSTCVPMSTKPLPVSHLHHHLGFGIT